MSAQLTALALGVMLAGVPAAAVQTIEQLKTRVARQTDPAERAKLVARLGPLLLDEFAAAFKSGEYDRGAAGLTEYLDYIRDAFRDLEQSGRQARRKPKGFKELEIHLRKATIQLEDLARAVPFAERAPIEAAREEMDQVREKLVRALFDLPAPPADGSGEEKKP